MSDQPNKPQDADPASPDNGVQPPEENGLTAGDAGSSAAEPEIEEPALVDPDEVQLTDPLVSSETLEPELGTTADDVTLTEPSLEPVRISDDIVQAASLDEIAAETRRVEREAEEAGTLVGGPMPADVPAEKAVPAGTAPAGGPAGDTGRPSSPPAPSAPPVESAAAPPVGAGTNGDGALTSFAVTGESPTWMGATTDEERWARLYDDQELAASGTDRHEAVAQLAEMAEETPSAPQPEPTLASGVAPVNLPPSIPAPPASKPDAAGTPPVSLGTPTGQQPEPPEEQPVEPTDARLPQDAGQEESPADRPWGGQHAPYPPADPSQQQARGPQEVPLGGHYGLPPAGMPPGPGTGQPGGQHRPENSGTSKRTLIIIGVVSLAVLVLLIFAIFVIFDRLNSGPAEEPNGGSATIPATAGADGIIAESVPPLDLPLAACLLDFETINDNMTVVTCATPHNAQLLATENYPDDSEFPGDEALNLRAQELCDGVMVNEAAAAEYPGLQLTQASPSQSTWANGDRRVDCFVFSEDGNIITDDLLAE
ncbi:septum formation family protein [Arthrobacter sp. H5]|uniref:septum formation family protein n=1 Tax=Arthrobacter sp. H5 TaxID=1267973 RepID=UPI000484F5D4|nr:septum formation family protein [Arthrobacter sp. H5]